MLKNDGHARLLMVVVSTTEVVCVVAVEDRMVGQMAKDVAAFKRTAVVVVTFHEEEVEH